MVTRFRLVSILTLVLALPALALAAAPSTNQAEKVAEGMLNFDKSLAEANAQVDATLNAMNAMTKQDGKLVDNYKIFTKEVDKLGKTAEKAKSNSLKANAQRDDFLKQWQASQETIQNPQLKASSEARRAELVPKIEAIKSSLADGAATFTPFQQNLKDLTIFLGNVIVLIGQSRYGLYLTGAISNYIGHIQHIDNWQPIGAPIDGILHGPDAILVLFVDTMK
jgi:L-rhamnose mutarotase